MSATPNFRRGSQVDPTVYDRKPVRDGSWVAKYNGSCAYCGSAIVEGDSRVRWNEERTQVVCAVHR